MKNLKSYCYSINLAIVCAILIFSAQPLMAQAPPPPTEPLVPTSAPTPLLRLRAGSFDPQNEQLTIPQRLQNAPAATAPALHLVQFSGPIQDSWYAALQEAGLEIVAYIPDYAYLVWGEANTINALQKQTPLRWSGNYHPFYALHPSLLSEKSSSGPDDLAEVIVQLYDHADAEKTIAKIRTHATAMLREPYSVLNYRNLALRLPSADLEQLAAYPGVVNVEPMPHYKQLDEIQGQILAGNLTTDGIQPSAPGYLAWLQSLGFSTDPADYPIVDITDDGVDNGSNTPEHADFYEFGDKSNADRLAYNYNWTGDSSADGGAGHGNINASIAVGYNDQTGSAYEDSDGYNYGLGINPYGRVAGSKVFENAGYWDASGDNEDLIRNSYELGTRISSNSWGSSNSSYTVDSQEYDALVRDALTASAGNQEMIIIFAAGNDGSAANTIGSPATAKNVIAVGASENYRPTWTDGCNTTAADANNAHDIADFSSRGPTSDQRLKPELVAPGTHIQGAASQIANYDGTGVCDKYHPSGQTLYAASSGTSHSAPAVAGAASLLYYYYENNFGGAAPSPAMVKAFLVNSARYLDGVDSGDTLPSNDQGYGEVHLATAFDDTARIVEDQEHLLQASGETYNITGSTADPSKPLIVTLAWTDAPGSTSGDAYVNDLNLELEIDGQTYLGNHYSGATSTTGGTADPRNNIESISLPVGVNGAFTLKVNANNIAGDGVPSNSDPTDQDFALVCYNCAKKADFDIDITPAHLDICAPADAVYTATLESILGYTEAVTLSADNTPNGTTTTFTPNPVTPSGTSLMTISDTENASTGNYNIEVIGTGATPTDTHSSNIQLNVFNAAPGNIILNAPANGAQDVSDLPTLSWFASTQAATYHIEIARDAAFSDIVTSTTAGTHEYTLSASLDFETRYYWRVTAQNPCGTGTTSPTYSFTTQEMPLVFCSAPSLAIPDDNANGASDTQTVPDAGKLLDLNVALTVTHSFVGDLTITLEHVESARSIKLVERPGHPLSSNGCSGENIDVLLDDDATQSMENDCASSTPAYTPGGLYSPNEPLSTFAGDLLGGTWRIKAIDGTYLDSGTLEQWCLLPSVESSDAGIATSPATLSSTQAQDTQYTQTLSITNTGDAALIWSIQESSDDCATSVDIAWLNASPVSGNTAAQDQELIEVTFDSDGQTAGSYTGTLCINSNDPLTPLVKIPVSMNVENYGLSLSSTSVEVMEGGISASYQISLTSQPTAAVSVTLQSNGQSTPNPANIVFDAGNWDSSRTINVTAVDDSASEGRHFDSITHTLSSADANYDGLSVPHVSVDITDNDTPGLAIFPKTVTLSEGASAQIIKIALTTAPSDTVTVTLNSDVQSEAQPSSLIFSPANWDTQQDVSITAVDDNAFEGTHTSVISTSSSSLDPNYAALNGPTLDATITDNDIASVAFSAAEYTVAAMGQSAQITAILIPSSTLQVSVNYSTGNGSALAGTDYIAAQGVITFSPQITSQVITVNTLNNPANTTSRTLSIQLQNPTNAQLGTQSSSQVHILGKESHWVYLPILLRAHN